eukprot:gnl/Trimastix_PCT/3182.p1 GENE.gnl/Trimastix_PCT/3182~~gnl/Trimastix_PCT/3182.p1  ORF type:complete len:386 (+),score=96.79 gnl/Trimastix_PCT/3182:119-1276(+)
MQAFDFSRQKIASRASEEITNGCVEDYFLLRLPLPLAQRVREIIDQSQDSRHRPQVQCAFNDDCRHATISVGEETVGATLVDMPCILETQKTLDGKTYFKCGDVGQMLVVHPDGTDPTSFARNSGVTPPTHKIVKRKWKHARRALPTTVNEDENNKVDLELVEDVPGLTDSCYIVPREQAKEQKIGAYSVPKSEQDLENEAESPQDDLDMDENGMLVDGEGDEFEYDEEEDEEQDEDEDEAATLSSSPSLASSPLPSSDSTQIDSLSSQFTKDTEQFTQIDRNIEILTRRLHQCLNPNESQHLENQISQLRLYRHSLQVRINQCHAALQQLLNPPATTTTAVTATTASTEKATEAATGTAMTAHAHAPPGLTIGRMQSMPFGLGQ